MANHAQLGMRILLEVDPNAPLIRPATVTPNAVTINGFAFGPDALTVPMGTHVTWSNTDPTDHTVTAANQSFTSDPIPSGGSFVHVFDRVGSFSYVCAIHPTMKGRVTVAP